MVATGAGITERRWVVLSGLSCQQFRQSHSLSPDIQVGWAVKGTVVRACVAHVSQPRWKKYWLRA